MADKIREYNRTNRKLSVVFSKECTTYIHTYTYSFTDQSSAHVGYNVEFVIKRAKLQYAVNSINKLRNHIELIRT
jgi:hypothetical protein